MIRRKKRYRNNFNGYRDKQIARSRERYHEKHPEAKYYLGYGEEKET